MICLGPKHVRLGGVDIALRLFDRWVNTHSFGLGGVFGTDHHPRRGRPAQIARILSDNSLVGFPRDFEIALGGGQVAARGGKGGRNQELALAAAIALEGWPGVTVVALATDGTDGPTNAAGGIVDGFTADDPALLQSALERADAGPYLAQRDALFRTGPTRTNVMDLVIAIVA